jgi:HemY protein
MTRLVAVFLFLVIVAGLASLVAGLGGEARLALQDYELVMRLPVLLGGFLLLTLAAIALFALGHYLSGLPTRLARRRAARLREKGEADMALALMALARGDGAAADRAARQAQQFLPQQALPHLLAAQAAIQNDSFAEAETHYRQLLAANADNDRRSLGLEGLYYLAKRQNRREPAATYALQALELAPKSKWALDGLMALAVEIGDWPAAMKWFKRWARSGVTRQQKRDREAILLTGAALAALADDDTGNQKPALEKLVQAARLAPQLIPAIAHMARVQAAQGQMAKARRGLRQAWAQNPHAELARAWLDIYAGQAASTRQRAVGQFVGKQEAHIESHILKARIALQGGRFSLAKALLDPHAEIDMPERRVCYLMAEAETGLGEPQNAQIWRNRARQAPPDAGWMAGGMMLEDWSPVCPVSGRIGGVVWARSELGLLSPDPLSPGPLSPGMMEAGEKPVPLA